MWGSSRRVLQELVASHVRCFSQTSCKNTVVVERWWQIPLAKEGRTPALHQRHRIYKVVEGTERLSKETKLELILTQTVGKLGGRGDTVRVKKSFGRSKLLAEGLAVYPSPENKQMFAEEIRVLHEGKPEDRIQTRTGLLTVNFLKRSQLKICKWPSDEYTLTKEIVCRQFARKLGVMVPLHALRLPDEPIKDVGEYWCEVTVNGIDTVRIPVSVLPYEDQSAVGQNILKKLRQEKESSITAEASAETAAHELEASELSSASESTAYGESTASPEPLPAEDKTGPPTENHPKD